MTNERFRCTYMFISGFLGDKSHFWSRVILYCALKLMKTGDTYSLCLSYSSCCWDKNTLTEATKGRKEIHGGEKLRRQDFEEAADYIASKVKEQLTTL